MPIFIESSCWESIIPLGDPAAALNLKQSLRGLVATNQSLVSFSLIINMSARLDSLVAGEGGRTRTHCC